MSELPDGLTDYDKDLDFVVCGNDREEVAAGHLRSDGAVIFSHLNIRSSEDWRHVRGIVDRVYMARQNGGRPLIPLEQCSPSVRDVWTRQKAWNEAQGK